MSQKSSVPGIKCLKPKCCFKSPVQNSVSEIRRPGIRCSGNKCEPFGEDKSSELPTSQLPNENDSESNCWFINWCFLLAAGFFDEFFDDEAAELSLFLSIASSSELSNGT